MTFQDFQKIKPQLTEAFRKAFLKAEQKHPGFLRRLFQAWAEGPPEGR